MTLHLLHLHDTPIYKQLQLEEALLRLDNRNWCLINEGSPPSIVMGISGKAEEWVDLKKIAENPVPIIKRFSGGGTVFVDGNTLFVTFIFQKESHPFPAYPEPILKWTASIYQEMFPPEFQVQANDYAIGIKKCGGNAQYIKKDRWLHHTTFLWDYHEENMNYLLHPPKMPAYRKDRKHADFLCRLRDHFPEKSQMVNLLKITLKKQFIVENRTLEDIEHLTNQPHRQATTRLFS